VLVFTYALLHVGSHARSDQFNGIANILYFISFKIKILDLQTAQFLISAVLSKQVDALVKWGFQIEFLAKKVLLLSEENYVR